MFVKQIYEMNETSRQNVCMRHRIELKSMYKWIRIVTY